MQGSWRKVPVTDKLPVKTLQPPPTTTRKKSAIPEGEVGLQTAVNPPAVGEVGDEVREKEKMEEEGERKVVLLPRTSNTTELWPVILTKAILKVAALEYVVSCLSRCPYCRVS